MNFLVVLTIFFIIDKSEANLVAWLLGRDSSPFIPLSSDNNFDLLMSQTETVEEEPVNPDNLLVEVSKIPFELSAADEKFIADAQKYTDLKLSELDVCQHKLVLQLKQDCNDLTEDDLSKLGVNLLNCQSKQEGRPVYPCLSSMSLKECTRDMDSDTWNAYHIMSNRARSVCYGARQQQFRALTQMTVNKLMASSSQQLGFIQELKAEQEELGDLAAKTLGSLTKGQDKLLEQQDYLKATQQLASQQIGVTIRELSRERTAAFASQKQLSAISQTLKETLDQASKMASEQESERKLAQQNLMQSLTSIEGHVGDFWDQLENSVEKLLVQQEHAVYLQSETVQTLQRLNETFQFLLSVSEHSKEQLNWIQGLVATTEKKLGNLSTWLIHVGYFLFGMLLLSFAQAPAYTRCIFLMIVPINLMMDLQHGVVMELPALITLLVIVSLVYRFLSFLKNRLWATKLQYIRYEPEVIKLISSTPQKMDESDQSMGRKINQLIGDCTLIEDNAFDDSCSSSTPVPTTADWQSLHQMSQTSTRSLFADQMEDASFVSLHRRSSRISSNSFRELSPPISTTPNKSRIATPRRPSTPNRRNCSGKCVDGSICRNSAMKDSTFCWQHK